MKTFQKFLTSSQAFGEELPTDYKPTFRSSAVFPVKIIPYKLDTIVTFMGYWFLKRQIQEVSVVITLRLQNGKTFKRTSIIINEVKSYNFSMATLFSEYSFEDSFLGSVEIEIFSARDMVFPYPAITFAYKCNLGVSFVHTCGRIYNDILDVSENEQLVVPETGFDIIPDARSIPFFSFVNGPIEHRNELLLFEFINSSGSQEQFEYTFTKIKKYETIWFDLLDTGISRDFFKNKNGVVKIKHQLKGFFPRFVAGNYYKETEAISLTHSYYDTSQESPSTAIWKNENVNEYYDAIAFLPIDFSFSNIELAIYPNYFAIDCKIKFIYFDDTGKQVAQSKFTAILGESHTAPIYVNAKHLLEEELGSLDNKKLYLCKAVVDGNGVIPVRLKFGLNLSNENKISLPSNVCFNAEFSRSKAVKKPGSFRWCPILDIKNQKIMIINAPWLRTGGPDAICHISFWNSFSNQSLDFKITVSVNSTLDIIEKFYEQIFKFLNGDIGWVTIKSNSPYTWGYYICDSGLGLVGADHFF